MLYGSTQASVDYRRSTLFQWSKASQCFTLFFLLGLLGVSKAQDVTALPTSQLQSETRDLVANGEFVRARPYLVELERRLIELPPEQQGEALESVYVFLSVANLQTYGATQEARWLTDAIDACDKYISGYPNGNQLGVVLINKGDALRAQGKFAEAAPVLEQAMNPPASDRLSSARQLETLEKIVQAYYVTENWEKGIPWFQRQMEYKDFPDRVSQAATALVEAYIATNRPEEMMAFVPVLARDSSARYNIRLNAKLIEGADKLSKGKNYAQASFLYNLVLSKGELITYHQGVLDRVQQRINWIETNQMGESELSKLRIDLTNAENQVKALKEVADYSAELEWRKAQTYQQTGRDFEAFWAFYRLLNDFPDRTDQIEDYHYAAFVQASEIDLTDYVIELGESYILGNKYNKYIKEVTFMLADVYKTEGPFERFRNLATQFVVKYPNDDFAGAMIYLLADAYSARGDYEALSRDFGEMIATMDGGRVMDGLYYWRGMAGIFLEDYDLSRQSFTQLFDQYQTSAYLEDAEFRIGVVNFASGDLESARETMVSFLEKYPESILLGEVHVYLGDLYASEAEVELALDHYMQVEHYTDLFDFIDHAYFQSARLCEENEFFDRMASILQDYLDKFPESPNLSKAIYEVGRAYEMDGSAVDALLSYRDAIQDYGDQRLSFGVDEIIDAFPVKYEEHYTRLKATSEFLESLISDSAFRESILSNRRKLFEYLSENPGIDRAVRDLVMRNSEFRKSLESGEGLAQEVYNEFKEDFYKFPPESPEEIFQSILTDAVIDGRKTLQLRMGMALDRAAGKKPEVETFSREDLDYASPAVMVWMAQSIRESGDLSLEPLAREALEAVIANYRQDEASQFSALMEYGQLEISYANFEAAQSYLVQAREGYPFDARVTDATLLLADAYRIDGKHDKAIENYELLLRDKQLYGKAIRAEVQYKIGLSFFERGLYQESHAYFERVFLAFSGFKEWTALAYLKDAEALISLGAREDAARTLKEAIKVAGLRETEAYPDIEKLYQTFVTN
ncbi:MAG: tetratricopeptide repeat protein [Opitutales bacterium]